MQELHNTKAHKVAEWRQRLARFAGGELAVKDFCQAESVSQASFHRWRKQLQEAGDTRAQAGFIDAGLLPSAAPEAAEAKPGAPLLEVRLELAPGLVLHIVRR